MLKLLLGDPNTRKLKRYHPLVEDINSLETEISILTDDDFNLTYNFIKEIDVSYLHVFTYSRRENTKADKFKNQIDNKVKKARRIILQKLSEYKYKNFINKNINNVREVLFENFENGFLSGLSDNYLKVYVPGNKKYINTIQKVKILNNDKFIFGEIVNE